MYSIGEASRLTGITSFTLRYYEKIGLLPNPQRQNGIRQYDEQDIRFIQFIHGLKQTGMTLENIAMFVEDGCLLTQRDLKIDIKDSLRKRTDILNQHIEQLERQMRQLETVKSIAQKKRDFYNTVLQEQPTNATENHSNDQSKGDVLKNGTLSANHDTHLEF